MSGRSGFQSWTGSSYNRRSEPVASSEEMWDEPSQLTNHTQVFHNQSLKNTVNDGWDAWAGNYTADTTSVQDSASKVRNYGGMDHQHSVSWRSGDSRQYSDTFGQQSDALSPTDSAPFEMKIPARQVGVVIGKGGSRVRELQMSTGANIHVRKNDVDSNGMVLVKLEGGETARMNAKKMIDELLENDSNPSGAGRSADVDNRQTSRQFGDGENFHTSILTVASNMLGAVIGRGGQKIREIEGKSQTRIRVGDNRFGSTVVEVTIHGSEDGRRQAKSLIEDVILAESEAGYLPDSERPDFGGRQQKSGSSSADLQVPTKMLGAIIGRGGQNIKDTSDKTQTKIKIADDRSGAVVNITISGSDDGQQQAKSMIEDIIRSLGESHVTSSSEKLGSQTGNQQRSGFGDFNNSEATDRPKFASHSEFSGFGDGSAGSRQRSGFGNFDSSEPAERSFGSHGRSSFGNPPASQNGFSGPINWDHVKQLSQMHEEIKWKGYPPIKKNFYIEHADVSNMDPEEVAEIREQNNKIMVSCDEDREVHIPNPVRSFDEGFMHYPEILDELKRAGFAKPSPIQMQGWPIALQGLDLIGIAQTGTGKTLAFLLPAFIHIEGQPVPRADRGGPNVLVLSPTRELALQIEHEVKKYKYRDINCVCIYGGGNRREQINIVTKGVEIVVATPGRLNDLISSNVIDVKSVTYLVLDEADRMLDLGFEPEIRKILIDIRPDRQTIMTSATWPAGVRRLATSYMKNPIRVFVGSLDLTAVHSVLQRVEIVLEEDKRNRLAEFLTQEMADDDKAIVFVGRKCTVDSISSDFALCDIRCQSIHGGREQYDREQALEDLKEGVVRILIATDVASRGIDIKDVTHIVNFDFPHNIEEYVHRIGRTGRAGRSGESLTFMTRADWRHAAELIKIMEEANQEVPTEVYDMAQRYESMRERRRNEGSDRFGGRGDFDDFSGFRDNGRRGGRRDRERALKVAYM